MIKKLLILVIFLLSSLVVLLLLSCEENLGSTGNLTGSLVDEQGNAMKKVKLKITGVGTTIGIAYITTNDTGNFSFYSMPTGDYFIVALDANENPIVSVGFTIEADKTTTLNLVKGQLTPTPTIAPTSTPTPAPTPTI